MNKNLEALLRWSTENTTPRNPGHSTAVTLPDGEIASTGAAAAAAGSSTDGGVPELDGADVARPPPKKIDPAILDAILGKSDAQRMLEAVRDLKSEGLYSDEQKRQIWDDLELLVSNLDNANDLEKIGLWQPIYEFLDSPDSQTKLCALWVLGTAIQNNPRSQTAFGALDPLPRLLAILSAPGSSADLRSKTIYTISGLLRHEPIQMARFARLQGWEALGIALTDPSLQVRRKTIFFINSLFMNTTSDKEARDLCLTPAQDAGVIDTILSSLDKAQAVPAGENGEFEDIDLDYADKGIIALCTIVQKTGVDGFTDSQRDSLRELIRRTDGNRGLVDLSEAEWEEFKAAVKA